MMKKSPESIILAVALALLTLAALGLALTFPSPQDITGVPSTSPSGKTPPKLNQADLDAGFAPWNTPTMWPDSKHRLFLSDRILFYPGQYPDGDYIKRVEPASRTPSGVLISWYQKYDLDFTDSDIDREDPDNDGFSNIVEFKNGEKKAADADGTKSTSPMDPQSHPSYLSRLRLQKYESRPFHIQFRGIQELNGVQFFQIYLKDVPIDRQPGLKKTGDNLGYEGYVVGNYTAKMVSREDPATHITTQVDESVLVLEKPDIGFKIPLTYRQETDSPESTANFVMLMPSEIDRVMKVPRGKNFTPPFMDRTTFLLLEVKADGALVRNVQTKEELKIPLLDPSEWNEVPVPGAAKPPPKAASP